MRSAGGECRYLPSTCAAVHAQQAHGMRGAVEACSGAWQGTCHSCAAAQPLPRQCDMGQCGGGDPTNTSDSLAGTRVVGGLKFRFVSAGGRAACGIADDGQTYCWCGQSCVHVQQCYCAAAAAACSALLTDECVHGCRHTAGGRTMEAS